MASHKSNFYFNFEGDNNNNHNLPVHPYTNFNSLETNSPLSGSTYHDTDSLSEEKSKVIRKKRNTYQKIDDESRILLLELVKQGETLKAAARRYGINYSSAKSILHTFRKEGRILKKSAQERNARKRPTRTTSDLEMSPIYPYKQCQDINNDGSEDASQQTYYSSELKLKSEPSSFSHLTEEESPKFTILNPIAINSFGDFLKIESQGHTKSDPLNTRSPAPTRIFKLEPQHLQRNSSMEVKGGNWQLNVNVHNQIPLRDPNSLDANNAAAIRVPGDLKSVDVFNYPNSSSPVVGEKILRAETDYEPVFLPKRYNTIADIMTHTDDAHAPEEPIYDISCYLNSSPAYAFPSKTNEADQFVGMDNLRGMSEPQDCYYDGQSAYYGNYGPGSNKENGGVVSSANLRTY